MKKTRQLLIVVMGLALGGPAMAQVAPRPVKRAVQQPIKSKSRPAKQRLDFTRGDTVEAGIANAAGELVGGRIPPRMSKLITVRANFFPELMKSAEDV